MRAECAGSALLAPYPVPPCSLRRWRREAKRALLLARADGFDVPGEELLSELLARAPETWPGTVVLAGAAVEAADSEFGRICLGYSLLAEDRTSSATDLFRALANAGVPQVPWRVLEGLALAHEGLGRYRLALGAMEAAADRPDCGVGPLVTGLYLALRTGDKERALRAAARLDLLINPDVPEFAAALAQLRRRLGDDRQPIPGSMVMDSCSDEAASPAERVCRTLA